jgi:hypothetical protein
MSTTEEERATQRAQAIEKANEIATQAAGISLFVFQVQSV